MQNENKVKWGNARKMNMRNTFRFNRTLKMEMALFTVRVKMINGSFRFGAELLTSPKRF